MASYSNESMMKFNLHKSFLSQSSSSSSSSKIPSLILEYFSINFLSFSAWNSSRVWPPGPAGATPDVGAQKASPEGPNRFKSQEESTDPIKLKQLQSSLVVLILLVRTFQSNLSEFFFLDHKITSFSNEASSLHFRTSTESQCFQG